jgi:hypothetical protein
MESQDSLEGAVADWIFIDRDVCGFSLHSYDRHDACLIEYECFTSSPHGRRFKEELSDLHAAHATSEVGRNLEIDDEEEILLDSALRLAQVDDLLLTSPEEYPQITQLAAIHSWHC